MNLLFLWGRASTKSKGDEKRVTTRLKTDGESEPKPWSPLAHVHTQSRDPTPSPGLVYRGSHVLLGWLVSHVHLGYMRCSHHDLWRNGQGMALP